MIETATKLLLNEQIVEVDNLSVFKWLDIYSSIQKQINLKNKYIIKLNLIKTTKDKLYFNVVFIEDFKGFINEPFVSNVEAGFPPKAGPSPAEKPASTKLCNIPCLIIPTGVGASFGGYAGDANPIAKLFASQSEYLITHPNVLNGAVLSDLPTNVIYLEGFLVDQFLLGNISLIPKRQNKIGVIFDKGISQERLEYEVNVLNALRILYGCEIIAWTVTEEPLSIEPVITKYGFSSGKITNLEYVIEKALGLKKKGVTALAVCCAIPDIELNKEYVYGVGIDPIGGIESIISHVISAATGLVSAHAPVLMGANVENIDYKNISPLSSSEYIAKTFLPSVISGLRFAPKILSNQQSAISNQQISQIVLPYNGFGSAGVLYLAGASFVDAILVKENKTCLDVNPKQVNIKFREIDRYVDMFEKEVIELCGIDKNVLKRPIEKIKRL